MTTRRIDRGGWNGFAWLLVAAATERREVELGRHDAGVGLA